MKSKSVAWGLLLTCATTALTSGQASAAEADELGAANAEDDAAEDPDTGTENMDADLPDEEGAAAADSAGERSSTGAGARSSEAGDDGGRFRFGVALGAGPLSTDGLDMTYYGADLRFGWQLSDALAVYAQPQIGYYKMDGASVLFGSGGLMGTSVLADYTIIDRFFVGGGVGYAVLNSPSGIELHLRGGGYPLMSRSDNKVRRRGLMLGVDFRMHFVEGYTFIAPTFNVGYDAF